MKDTLQRMKTIMKSLTIDKIEDDSDDWDVETDDETYEEDLNQKTHNATNIKKEIKATPAPVRHQTAPQAFKSILDLVNLIFYDWQRIINDSPRYLQQQLLCEDHLRRKIFLGQCAALRLFLTSRASC